MLDRRRHPAILIFRLALGALATAPFALRAADITWVNQAGGDWNLAANWDSNSVPGLSDRAILGLNVTVTVNTSATVGSVTLSNGTLTGTATLTVENTMDWLGGTMAGSGITAIASGGMLNINGGTRAFVQRSINNAGNIVWTAGDIWSGSSASISNLAGGVFDLQGDQSWLYNEGGNPPIFNNAGTVKKSSGTGMSGFGAMVNNDGSLSVQTGTLSLGNGGDSHGAFSAVSGATLSFAGGTMILETNSSVSAAGTIALSGGTVEVNGAFAVAGNMMMNGAVARFNSTATAQTASLSAGSLGGGGTLTIDGTLNWTGGAMIETGITAIAAGGMLNLGGSTKAFVQRSINNAGTIVWTAGDIWSGSSATINNQAGGVFDLQGDQSWMNNEGGNAPIFNNAGTFKKSSGTGTSGFGAMANNNGSFSVQTGTLSLGNGGDSHGTFSAVSGATLNFAGGTMILETNSSVSAAGAIALSGGTVEVNGVFAVGGSTMINGATARFNSAAMVHDVSLSSGNVGGGGTLTIDGTLNWTGGAMIETGTTAIAVGGTLNLGGSTKAFVQRSINNAGTIVWTAGDIWSGSSATINNQAGGVFDLQGDQSWMNNEGGNAPIFNNAGMFKKSSGTGMSGLGAMVNNDGSLSVQTGTLSLGNGGDSHGTFSAASGATLNFAGGTMILESNSVVSAAGTIGFSGGTVQVNGDYSVAGSTLLNGAAANFNSAASAHDASLSSGSLGGAGTLTVTETMTWTGGSMVDTGATSIALGASLDLSGGTKAFVQRTINNAGSMVWTAGDIWSGSSATINNQAGGVFDLQGDQSWANNEGGNSPVFNNAGIFQKSSGAGTSSLTAITRNSGTISLQSGTLNLNGASFANQTNGIVQGSATLDISHTVVTADGQFNPGSPLGALHVLGNLPQSPSGRINIELGGTAAGVNFDQLVVSGTAALVGALNISLVNGFVPVTGQTFEVMRYASHTGTFDNISGLNLGGGFYLEPAIAATNLVLTMVDNRPRPRFSAPVKLSDGSIHITLTGIAGQSFAIQATTNFTDWITVLTNTDAGPLLDYVVTDTTNYPYRFFRTVQ